MILAILVGAILVNLSLGLLVLTRRPKRLDSFFFFLSVCSMVLWALGAYLASAEHAYEFNLWMVRLAYFGSYNILFWLLLFIIYFIKDEKNFLYKKRKYFGWAGAVLSLLAFTNPVVPYITPAAHGGVDEGVGILKIPFLLLILFYAVVIFYLLRFNIKRSTSPQMKTQLRLILFGIIVSFIVGFVFNAIIPLVTQSFVTAKLGPACVVFLAFFVSVAIIKHRLFDIRLVVARSLAYIFSLLLLAFLYAVLTFGIASLFFRGEQPSPVQQISYVVLALLLAVTFSPLKKRFDLLTQKVFYREGYDTQKVLDKISSGLVRSVSLTNMSEDALKDVSNALKPIYAAIVVRDSRGGFADDDHVISMGDFQKAYIDLSIKTIERFKHSVVVTDEIAAKGGGLIQELESAQIAVVARLHTPKETVGYLILGYKNSGNIYNQQDINLIRIVADELAVAIQNSLRFEEIQHFNETLQEKIDIATHRLQRANARLKQLNETKDEFVSMASHQLRTPLTSIKGYLSMVLEGDAGKLNPTQDKLLREAFTSSERMVRLIGDFLNVSRLRTGRFVIERKTVNMADLVAAEVEQLKPTAHTRELTIEFEKPANIPEMDVDKGKIQQVVMNLIDNAIFYSHPKDKIRVELYKHQNDIIFKVKDQGIGVPAEEKKRLFTKFFRASNARKQRPDGTGIGLFMAQKVIVAHGGSIIFESTEGKGSTFGFRLPMKLSDADLARAAAIAEKDITEE